MGCLCELMTKKWEPSWRQESNRRFAPHSHREQLWHTYEIYEDTRDAKKINQKIKKIIIIHYFLYCWALKSNQDMSLFILLILRGMSAFIFFSYHRFNFAL